jgi:hypothetical protein
MYRPTSLAQWFRARDALQLVVTGTLLIWVPDPPLAEHPFVCQAFHPDPLGGAADAIDGIRPGHLHGVVIAVVVTAGPLTVGLVASHVKGSKQTQLIDISAASVICALDLDDLGVARDVEGGGHSDLLDTGYFTSFHLHVVEVYLQGGITGDSGGLCCPQKQTINYYIRHRSDNKCYAMVSHSPHIQNLC